MSDLLPKLGLCADRKKEIRQQASILLRKVDYRDGAVPIEKIAAALGATIKYAPFDGQLAGMLIRSGAHKVIAVNSSHHKNRQRFTVAHECGHLLLHNQPTYIDRSFSIINRDEKSSQASIVEEIEANQFAADIMMPYRNVISDIVKNDIDLEDNETVSRLAKYYGVSIQSMSYRIAKLLGI